MGGTSGDAGDSGLDGTSEDTGDSGLDGTSGDTGDLGALGNTSPNQSIRSISKMSISSSIWFPKTSCSSPSVAGEWAGLPFKPSITTKTPSGMDNVACSHTWSGDA